MPAVLATLATFFIGNFIARILLGAGLTLISIIWVGDMVNTLLADSANLMLSGSGDVISLLGLGGVWQAMSTTGSAILARVAIISASNFLGVKIK